MDEIPESKFSLVKYTFGILIGDFSDFFKDDEDN